MYDEAEHLERASPEDITTQQHNMVTRDAVVYLHPITYDTTPTATRHRHPVYAHLPQRRPSSGPTFPPAELAKHPQMNRVFPSDSAPRPLFNPPLVACREDQSEYIAYHYRQIPADQSTHYPRKSLTRLIDAHHLFLSEKLHEISRQPSKPRLVRLPTYSR